MKLEIQAQRDHIIAEVDRIVTEKIKEMQDWIERRSCEKTGGQWVRGGILGFFHCVHTFKDGGNPCYSSEDCEGDCVVFNSNG